MGYDLWTITLYTILIVISLNSLGCLSDNERGSDAGGTAPSQYVREEGGYGNEGEYVDVFELAVGSGEELTQFFVDLTWMDEPDKQEIRTMRNRPDTLQMIIDDQEGVSISRQSVNEHGEEGRLTVGYPFEHTDSSILLGPVEVLVQVEVVDAGDYYPSPGLNINSIEDPGNDFHCVISYTLVNSSYQGSD